MSFLFFIFYFLFLCEFNIFFSSFFKVNSFLLLFLSSCVLLDSSIIDSFPSFLSKDSPTNSNNSFIPVDVKADTHLYAPLIDLAYSSATSFLISSFPYKSFLFPTIKVKTLFKSTVCLTSLYNVLTLLNESKLVIS